MHVLLVDDEPANLLAMESVLGELGATLVRALSGEEALAKARDTDFAAILLDVRMPVMDGFETARHLRIQTRSAITPIIFISGMDGSEAVTAEAYALGAVDFLVKPIQPHVLNSKVRFFIDLHQAHQALLKSRSAESALRESEKRLRQMANTIPNLAWMANADGWITWYNDRWYSYTGTTPAQMEGWGWQSVHDPQVLPEVLKNWTSSIATGAPFEMTFPLRGADGIFRPFFTLVAPLRDSAGKVVQWFGTNTDVSPLKKAEEELREADRRKDEFLAMLAHELRNPLAPIRTAAELLRRLGTGDPKLLRASEIIARQVGHMSGLLNDLLDVSRVTRGLMSVEKQPVELAAALASAVEQVRPSIESKQHHFRMDDPHLGIRVMANPLRLTQVFANLLDNAAKYSPPGSHIAVEVRVADGQVVIAVLDNGIGISAALLPRAFEPFSQGDRSVERAQGGLGLGLAVVKGLVELHGGTVTAASAGAGKGSRFEVTLPVFEAPAATASAADAALLPPAPIAVKPPLGGGSPLPRARQYPPV